MNLVRLRCYHIHLSIFSPHHRIWFEWMNGERINESNMWYKCIKISVHIQIYFFNCIFWLHLCSLWDPSSPTCAPCSGNSLNHWTTRKFPTHRFLHTWDFLSSYWDSQSVSCLCTQCPRESFYRSESFPGWRQAQELSNPHPRAPGRNFP